MPSRYRSLRTLATLVAMLALASAPALAQVSTDTPARIAQPGDAPTLSTRAHTVADGGTYTPSAVRPPDASFSKRQGGLIQDGGFEATTGPFGDNPSWDGVLTVNNATPFCNPQCLTGNPQLARTGDFFVIFGFGNVGTDFIEQTVTVPEAGDYNLQFYLRGGLADNNNNGMAEVDGAFSVTIDGTPVYTLSPEEALPFSQAYTRIDVPVSFEAAGAATVRFELDVLSASAPGDDVFQVTLDDITLGPPPVTDPILNAGIVATEILDDGYYGANSGNGLGILFDGENGLFEGQLLAGLGPETVYGEPYTPGEWVTTRAIANIDAPEGFDEAVETVFESSDGALQVTLRAFTAANAPVFLEYEVLNQSGADVSEVYVGPFADWDVGTFSSNLAGFDAGTNLLYVLDNSDPESSYFGIAALFSNAAPVSGTSGSLDLTMGTDDGELYAALTSLSAFSMVPGDRRTVLGTGPWAINDSDTVLARFALVAGESLAAITDAAESAQAAFPAPTGFDTGLVQTEILPGGFWGANRGDGTGFVFDGTNGLFEGQFIASVTANETFGIPYAGDNNGWVATSEPTQATPPDGFESAFTVTFASDDGALSVTQLAYANTGDPYVFFDYTLTNTSGGPLDEVYAGLFADWDIDDAGDDIGNYIDESQVLFASDLDAPLPFFGVAAGLSNEQPLSGIAFDVTGGGQEDEVFGSLTTFDELPFGGADRRMMISSGAYSLADGASATVTFFVVAGEDREAIAANAAAAQSILVDVEETTLAGTFALHSAFPNPFSASTTLGFTLPEATDVRLDVYDLLGRRVATLVDGPQAAGYTAVTFDAAHLSSGTYVYRLAAGRTQLVERFTLVR
ncbi:MAG: T9SS type A sorting domain-containing protein [Bacteroidota bacterium]